MSTVPSLPIWKAIYYSVFVKNVPLTRLNNFITKKGSTVKVYSGGIYPVILTIDPDFVQHVLQKNPRKYIKLSQQFDNIQKFWGKGLLTSKGPYWLKQRRLIQPGFHKQRLREVMKLMDKVSDEFLQNFEKKIAQQPTIDMYDEMQQLTCRVIANSIFSGNFKEAELNRISYILPKIQNFILKMIRQPYLHWWFRWSGQLKTHKKLREELDSIFRSYIQQREASGEVRDDLLQMLMDIRYAETGQGMTEKQLLDEISLLFIAGQETSAIVLTWVWYLLAQHPTVLKKMREEIQQIIPGNTIAFEQLMQLEYNQQVIEEAMRLYPPVWATNRVAREDDEFKGIPIKKGTLIATFFYGMHRSPDLWEDPTAFNPERFSKAQKKAQHSFAFLPFGGGPRLCIGKQFAMIEMKLVLAKMLKKYDVHLIPDQKIELLPQINLSPKNGIKMKVVKKKVTRQPKLSANLFTNQAEGKKMGCPFLDNIREKEVSEVF